MNAILRWSLATLLGFGAAGAIATADSIEDELLAADRAYTKQRSSSPSPLLHESFTTVEATGELRNTDEARAPVLAVDERSQRCFRPA